MHIANLKIASVPIPVLIFQGYIEGVPIPVFSIKLGVAATPKKGCGYTELEKLYQFDKSIKKIYQDCVLYVRIYTRLEL